MSTTNIAAGPAATRSDGTETNYLNGYHESVLKTHNWRTAENSANYLLPALTALVKEKPKATLLDLGCGSGTITASLATYIPQGQVTGMDISEEALSPARSHAERLGVRNVSFQTGSALELPFPDHHFDVTHCSQLLGHLPNPGVAIREMMRVTRKGGLVACREADLHGMVFYPPLPGLKKWNQCLIDQAIATGASHDMAGRKLKMWAKRAGAAESQITSTADTWCWSTPEEREAWGGSWGQRVVDSEYATKAIETGVATREELEEMSAEWARWVADDDGWFALVNGEILIRVE